MALISPQTIFILKTKRICLKKKNSIVRLSVECFSRPFQTGAIKCNRIWFVKHEHARSNVNLDKCSLLLSAYPSVCAECGARTAWHTWTRRCHHSHFPINSGNNLNTPFLVIQKRIIHQSQLYLCKLSTTRKRCAFVK